MNAANVLYVLMVASLSGCYIGPGGICGPQTPIYYCQSKADQEKMRPKPYGAHWVKEGMTREESINDWVRCGGHPSGSFSPSNEILSAGEKIGVSREDTRRTMEIQADACMVSLGYRFLRD